MRGRATLVGVAALTGCVLLAPGCAGRRERRQAAQALMTDEVLLQRALEALSHRNLARARDYLERIEFLVESQRQWLQPLVRVLLADVTFYRGDDLSLIEARSKYLDFVTFYGDHPLAPYAQFQAGMCSLKQVRHPSRDQSQTRVAIDDLREVLRRYPETYYAGAAREMIRLAESNLAEHEFLIGRYYLRHKVPKAAVARFQRVLDEYPYYRERDKLYFYISQALLADHREAEASEYLDRLLRDYAGSAFADEARKFVALFPSLGHGDDGAPERKRE